MFGTKKRSSILDFKPFLISSSTEPLLIGLSTILLLRSSLILSITSKATLLSNKPISNSENNSSNLSLEILVVVISSLTSDFISVSLNSSTGLTSTFSSLEVNLSFNLEKKPLDSCLTSTSSLITTSSTLFSIFISSSITSGISTSFSSRTFFVFSLTL